MFKNRQSAPMPEEQIEVIMAESHLTMVPVYQTKCLLCPVGRVFDFFALSEEDTEKILRDHIRTFHLDHLDMFRDMSNSLKNF